MLTDSLRRGIYSIFLFIVLCLKAVSSETILFDKSCVLRRLKEVAALDDIKAALELIEEAALNECLNNISSRLCYNSGLTTRWREELLNCYQFIATELNDICRGTIEKIEQAKKGQLRASAEAEIHR